MWKNTGGGKKKKGNSTGEERETIVMPVEEQVGKKKDRLQEQTEQVKGGWKDEQSEGEEEQTIAERHPLKESNLAKSVGAALLFQNVEKKIRICFLVRKEKTEGEIGRWRDEGGGKRATGKRDGDEEIESRENTAENE